MNLSQLCIYLAAAFVPGALLASVIGALRFAVRAFDARDRAESRRLEAVRARLEADESSRVWRGAAEPAKVRAREAENQVRSWRHIAEVSIEDCGLLIDALEADRVDVEGPRAKIDTRVN